MSLHDLQKNWDLIIIGGGITGAGILREATRMRLKAILLEQKDFAWGTSSRSSKLVHGGLRYIKEGHLMMTKSAVEERNRLLDEVPGLVETLGFYLPVYEEQKPGKRILKVGLTIYDIMGHKRKHRFLGVNELIEKLPNLNPRGLKGGFHYYDAQVDDSRLVLRLINESLSSGAEALNYTMVTEILRNTEGNAMGVKIEDMETHDGKIIYANAIINATGCWAEKLHPSPDPQRHLRPLRGSHLVFPANKLPIIEGLGFNHPVDNRYVFIVPWEGAVLVGSTDLDHNESLTLEPTATQPEIKYLMQAVHAIFPSLKLSLKDCISVFAGVRPVLSDGNRSPSEESREHTVWTDSGLVTVTGGKLTTFRRLAWDALKAAKPFLPPIKLPQKKDSIFSDVLSKPENGHGLTPEIWKRLYGRYGKSADKIAQTARTEDLVPIPGTQTLWAELPFVAQNEQIRHLDDLLLRRVRIGLLIPHGAKAHLKRIRKICKEALPWDRRRWKAEIGRYLEQWNHTHTLPTQRPERIALRKRKFFKTPDAFLRFIHRKILSIRRQRQTV
ncbi:MAG: glycerol-3-phosphate dehydrogenase/oxidase [Desulfobacterales bacterium]|jgi:glycerol-3-phosphate dehydrogenase